ncbi:MAG: pentapeptide repeat-containing protein, partial [Terriglobia bacterium]
MWRDVQEPRDDFLSRVADICRLRYRGAQVDDFRSDNSRPKYLRVQQADGTMTRVFPIGISETGISEEILQNFRQQVFAQYRALDPNLPCEVVYGGKHASDESIRKAGADGIRLSSFIEFQGIIDFRGYVERQTRKLEADAIYPPHVYVPQKLVYELGREQRVSGDACATVLDWLREPLARFVLVLGDFGTGKTFLLHEVARRIPTEIPHLVPMLIELRALEKSRTLLELVAQHLAASNETLIDLEAFPYMLREGRIALLFDGFDELAQRVTYDRAAEHFETLLQAAGGQARVVVTSRTQHFESDQQVKTALLARADVILGTHLARVQPFDEAQILLFLENLLGRPEDARKRFDLIHDVHDLLGLSHNPRMLGFIANLPEEHLRGAQERTGKITSAELYRLLIERWLTFEYERVQPRGAGPTLTVEERRRAATAVALCLWPKIERTIRLSELAEEVARAVDKLTERQLDERTAAHLVGSGTLLVRDQAGVFAFVHQSVMEWLVADEAARVLKTGQHPDVLAVNKMTPLMADFFCDLASHEIACNWAIDITTSPESAASAVLGASQAKTNALLVLDRLGVKYEEANLTGQDLRGRDFSGRNFAGANLARIDLTEARLVGANLRGADLSEAVLERADLSRANLGGAKLVGVNARGAKLLGADIREADLAGANLRRAKLAGAQFTPSALAGTDTFGAVLPGDGQRRSGLPRPDPKPMTSSASPCSSLAFGPDGIMAVAQQNGTIRLWDLATNQEVCVLRGHEESVMSVAFSPDGKRLASGGSDKTVRLWEAESGKKVATLRGHEESVMSVAFSPDGTRLASGGDDRTVRLWEAGSGKEVATLRGHEESVMSVAFSPDGKRLASGGDDRTVRLWEAGSGKEAATLRGHEESVRSVAFSPDGTRLASGGSDNTVRLWEAGSGKEVATLRGHENWVMSVAFSPDGRRLASGGSDNTVRLWEAKSGKEAATLRGHENWVMSVAFSPDGKRLASGGSDNT